MVEIINTSINAIYGTLTGLPSILFTMFVFSFSLLTAYSSNSLSNEIICIKSYALLLQDLLIL